MVSAARLKAMLWSFFHALMDDADRGGEISRWGQEFGRFVVEDGALLTSAMLRVETRGGHEHLVEDHTKTEMSLRVSAGLAADLLWGNVAMVPRRDVVRPGAGEKKSMVSSELGGAVVIAFVWIGRSRGFSRGNRRDEKLSGFRSRDNAALVAGGETVGDWMP